jgi:hypothetical protein
MAEPTWPSIESQLASDRIRPGTALDRLIRENQDFHLLRPEEANDRLGLPLWLRVYWRKQYPHRQYKSDDPTGGYPRALKELYAWMLANPDRVSHPPTPPESLER